MLPDQGSNLDIQIQNLTYYHYTIRQECVKVVIIYSLQKKVLKYTAGCNIKPVDRNNFTGIEI